MNKKCGLCGEIIEGSILECPKCGGGVFESEKIHQQSSRITERASAKTGSEEERGWLDKLLGVEAASFGVRVPISKKTIERVRQYQSMKHHGASPVLETPDMKYPQYKIINGAILRGGAFLEDIRLGQALPYLRRYSMVNLANPDEVKKLAPKLNQAVFLLIQNIAKIPIVYFCMNLPYLESKNPSKEGLQSPDMLVQVYKAIENMLFEIYEELGEGECITGATVLQKVVKILDIKELAIPKGWLEEINQFLI